ncbi:MAG: hypothetical protein E7589_02975 [Ruminococcaceae bacterium]|nr:hypothetical protein [Oscillospiraceae bacterium]
MKKFEELLLIAENGLRAVTPERYTQVVVLRSDNGYVCHAVIMDALSKENTAERRLINELKENSATLVAEIVCMWADGGVDLPSHDLRKMLCDCNSGNENAKMLLQGESGYITKTVGQTMC